MATLSYLEKAHHDGNIGDALSLSMAMRKSAICRTTQIATYMSVALVTEFTHKYICCVVCVTHPNRTDHHMLHCFARICEYDVWFCPSLSAACKPMS